MARCANCGAESGDTGKFCRNCGTKMQAEQGGEAATWRLQPNAEFQPDRPATSPVNPGNTGQGPHTTGPAYIPPSEYYQPLQTVPPPPPLTDNRRVTISVGDWLYGGWRIFSDNWALMMIASVFASFLSVCSVGFLAGPLLLGLFRMAFKSLKQERPEMSDLFNWDGKFLPALLASFIFAVLWFTISALRSASGFFWLVSIAVHPLIFISFLLTLPMLTEGRTDLAAAINSVGRLIFGKDAVMWWVVGLAFLLLSGSGVIACGVGVFVTVPWIICAAAVAYSSIYGLDDPNRTLR